MKIKPKLKKYSDGGKKNITITTGTAKRNIETNIFEKEKFQIKPKEEVLPKIQTNEYYDNFVKSKNYKYELNYPKQLSIEEAKKITNIPNTYGTINSTTEAFDLYNKSYEEDDTYLNNQVNAINYYDKQLNWLKNNMENSKYTERLKKEFGNNVEQILLKRKNNLLNSPIDVNVKSRIWNPVPETPNVQPEYDYSYDENTGEDIKTKTGKNRLTLLDPEYAKSRVLNGKKIIPTLAIHEGQHLITDQNKGMSDYAKNLYRESYLLNNNKESNNQYYSNPTEMDARKKALDFDMEKLGIKKYEEDFKPKHYKKILKLKNKLSDDSLEFLNIVKPENMQKIFNTIAYDKPQEQIPMARNGGSINKYPNGGREPIIVNDKNDPRLQNYNDSLNLYNSFFKGQDYLDSSREMDFTNRSKLNSINPSHPTIKPIEIIYYQPKEFTDLYKYKKPVQPVVYKPKNEQYNTNTESEAARRNIRTDNSGTSLTRQMMDLNGNPISEIEFLSGYERKKEPTYQLPQLNTQISQKEQHLEFDPIGLKKGTYFTRPRQQAEAGQGKIDYFDSKTGKLLKTMEFGGNIITENNMKTKIKKGKKLPKAVGGDLIPFTKDAAQNNQYNFNQPNYTAPVYDYGDIDESLYTDNSIMYNPSQTYNPNTITDTPIVNTPEFNPGLSQSVIDYNKQMGRGKTNVYGSPEELSQLSSTPQSKTNINWNNSFPGITGLGGNTFLSKGISQLGSGLTNIGKGTLDMFGNMKKNNREEYRNATQFGQLVYADAENRPQGQIYGKDIRGGNALFANGGMNIKEIGGQGEPNVEIEGKEHVLLPDGMSQTVQGDSHAEGGIPLNLAPGSMIFSEKLKDPTTGKSYAKLAKPFETKKDVERKDNKRGDVIQKNTADFVIKFKEDKLKGLFEQQEQDKLSGKHGKKVQMEAIQSLQQEQQMQPGQEQNQQPIAKYGMKLPKFNVGGVNYAALSNVEKQLGVLKNGMPSSTGYDDKSIHQLDSKMVERIKGTIGEDTWNKLPDNLKTQVFSFAFNNGVEKKNWLTGLAQAIDPAIKDRTTLSETDAISIIKNNIGKIDNNVYNNYINKVLPSQYNSIASSNNKQEENKKLWQFRPDNINQFLQNSNNQTPTTQPSVSPTFTGYNPNPVINTPQLPIVNQNNTQPSVNSNFTGVNPFVDIKALRLSPAVKKRRDEFLPFTSQNTPDVYGNPAYRESVFKEFEDRTGVKLNRANSDAINLEFIRNFQNQSTPELTKDYKLNFTRGNQDLYNEFTKQKGYKKSKDNTKESNNFYDWATANKKLTKDYADSGKWGHEYYNTATLDFETEAEYNKWRQDPDWEQVGNRFVDRSGDPNGVITYYDINKKWENKPAVKQPASDPVDPTQYKFKSGVKQQGFDMPNINMGIPLPYNEKTTPLNYYKIQPEFIDPRYLNVQPQLNDITRGVRTVQNNLGDRSTASVGNSLQAQINAYGQENQVYGNKYNYDKGQDSQAQQFNAQAKMNTDQYNQNSWYNQLEDPIRARSSAKNKQFKENQQRGLENWNEQMAFNNNSNYINDTFYNPKNINNINWGANLNPVDIKKAKESKWDDEIEKEQYIKQKKAELGIAKNGGKVRIKPKIKLK